MSEYIEMLREEAKFFGDYVTLSKDDVLAMLDDYAALESSLAELEGYKAAYNEFFDKTNWVQDTAKPHELGMHRADVLKDRIVELEKDTARLDSLEDIICESRTGVTIERVRYAEDGYVVESGFRAMKFHAVTELKSTIREAIDELLSREA